MDGQPIAYECVDNTCTIRHPAGSDFFMGHFHINGAHDIQIRYHGAVIPIVDLGDPDRTVLETRAARQGEDLFVTINDLDFDSGGDNALAIELDGYATFLQLVRSGYDLDSATAELTFAGPDLVLDLGPDNLNLVAYRAEDGAILPVSDSDLHQFDIEAKVGERLAFGWHVYDANGHLVAVGGEELEVPNPRTILLPGTQLYDQPTAASVKEISDTVQADLRGKSRIGDEYWARIILENGEEGWIQAEGIVELLAWVKDVEYTLPTPTPTATPVPTATVVPLEKLTIDAWGNVIAKVCPAVTCDEFGKVSGELTAAQYYVGDRTWYGVAVPNDSGDSEIVWVSDATRGLTISSELKSDPGAYLDKRLLSEFDVPAPTPTPTPSPTRPKQMIYCPVNGSHISQGYSEAHPAIDVTTDYGAPVFSPWYCTVMYLFRVPDGGEANQHLPRSNEHPQMRTSTRPGVVSILRCEPAPAQE